ncbi:MAG: hypothetical protein ACYC0H_23355, partial [Solirubrobacteraceae bacterium]
MIGDLAKQQIRLADRLDGASVVIDRCDRDTLAVARWVASFGARVTIADRRRSASARLPQAAHGVSIAWETDLNQATVTADILFVHDYTSPLEPFVGRARATGTIVA